MTQCDQNTRLRIILAAIDIFLEKGTRDATVREICEKANANVASINYHFGSKELLQHAVLSHILASCYKLYPINEGLEDIERPEDRLKRLIANLIRILFPPDTINASQVRLLWYAIGDPSQATALAVEHALRPVIQKLDSLIQEIAPSIDDMTRHLLMHSVAAQCVFYAQHRHVVQHMFPDTPYDAEWASCVAEFIFTLTIAGIDVYKMKSTQPQVNT